MVDRGSLRGDDRAYTGYRRSGIRLQEPGGPAAEDGRCSRPAWRPMRRCIGLIARTSRCSVSKASSLPPRQRAAYVPSRSWRPRAGTPVQIHGDGRHFGEGALIRRLGMEVGGYIHAGRSSWDLAGIAQRLPMRTGLLEVADVLNDYRAALLDLAEQHVETVMPYYTHGQQGPSRRPWRIICTPSVCVAERDFRRLGFGPIGR